MRMEKISIKYPANLLIFCVRCTRIEDSDQDEHVLKVRSNVLRRELQRSRLLKHNCDNVIADVSFP
jgi:hypothetical protein